MASLQTLLFSTLMTPWPDTESSLIQRIADPADDAAWKQFDLLYRPLIYRYARARGLQHADAESLVAEVLARVFRAASRWSHDQTASERPKRFNAWLSRIANNALLNLVTRQLARRGTGGTSHQLSLAGRPMPDELSHQLWDREHRNHLFASAAIRVQSEVDPEHWQVFWETHVEEVSVQAAAANSQRSIGSVYAIRSRILKRLRDAVQSLQRLEDVPQRLEGKS